jgi:hypothetical protein
MANPYHDADGKFASHDALLQNVQTALKDNDMERYIRERTNLDEIDREIEASKKENPFHEKPQPKPAIKPLPKTWDDVRANWERPEKTWQRFTSRYTDLRSQNEAILSHRLSVNTTENFNPYIDGTTTVSTQKLDTYEGKGSQNGIGKLEEKADEHSAMYDKEYVRAGDRTYTVSTSRLVYAQQLAAEEHAQQIEFIEGDLKNPGANVKGIVKEWQQRTAVHRQESADFHKRAQFELAYMLDRAAREPDRKDESGQIASFLEIIQKSHDDTVYAAVRERKLATFAKKAGLDS